MRNREREREAEREKGKKRTSNQEETRMSDFTWGVFHVKAMMKYS